MNSTMFNTYFFLNLFSLKYKIKKNKPRQHGFGALAYVGIKKRPRAEHLGLFFFFNLFIGKMICLPPLFFLKKIIR
jgi:hypothetical protein